MRKEIIICNILYYFKLRNPSEINPGPKLFTEIIICLLLFTQWSNILFKRVGSNNSPTNSVLLRAQHTIYSTFLGHNFFS